MSWIIRRVDLWVCIEGDMVNEIDAFDEEHAKQLARAHNNETWRVLPFTRGMFDYLWLLLLFAAFGSIAWFISVTHSWA